MLQPGREADLTLEALDVDAGRELSRQDLENDLTPQVHVFRYKDAAHPAAKLAFDTVVAAESRCQAIKDVDHAITMRAATPDG